MNKLGEYGEKKAKFYLMRRFYRIVAKNYQTKFGEIDIIAETMKYLIFVEVKQRSSNSIAKPSEAVDFRKQQKIIKTAKSYLMKHPTDKKLRFDIIEVVSDNNKLKSINHIKNAFTENA